MVAIGQTWPNHRFVQSKCVCAISQMRLLAGGAGTYVELLMRPALCNLRRLPFSRKRAFDNAVRIVADG